MEYVEQSVKTRIDAYTIDKTDDIYSAYEWLLLRYYDPRFSGISKADLPEEYPTDYLFEETGYGYMRQNWSGDEDTIAVRSGPVFGTKAVEKAESYLYSLGAGHQHPDQGHFQIYSNGRWIGLTVSECPGCLSYFHFAPFLFVLMILFCSILAKL